MIKTLMFVAVLGAGTSQAMAGVTRELLKGIGKTLGLEVGQEAAEAGSANIAKSLAKELVQEGSESVAKQTGKSLVKNLGDDAIRSASSAGDDLAKGLGSLSAQNARRLQMMSGELAATGKAGEVGRLISKGGSGDKVVDFLWRNKAGLLGGAAITTLLMHPDAVIAATSDVGKALITTAGSNIAVPMIQNAPVMTGILMLCILLASLTLFSVVLLRRHPLGSLLRVLKALRMGLGRRNSSLPE